MLRPVTLTGDLVCFQNLSRRAARAGPAKNATSMEDVRRHKGMPQFRRQTCLGPEANCGTVVQIVCGLDEQTGSESIRRVLCVVFCVVLSQKSCQETLYVGSEASKPEVKASDVFLCGLHPK